MRRHLDDVARMLIMGRKIHGSARIPTPEDRVARRDPGAETYRRQRTVGVASRQQRRSKGQQEKKTRRPNHHGS